MQSEVQVLCEQLRETDEDFFFLCRFHIVVVEETRDVDEFRELCPAN